MEKELLTEASNLISTDTQLEEILPNKRHLVFGGICRGASLENIDNKDMFGSPWLIANEFSFVCQDEDLSINIHENSNCHIKDDAYNFAGTICRFPSLSKHKFHRIDFKHIGYGFWGDLMKPGQRDELILLGEDAIRNAVCEKVKETFMPILTCLDYGGEFVYNSSVCDDLEDFVNETQIPFLTKENLKDREQVKASKVYECIAGEYRYTETTYQLEYSDHPVIAGYFQALRQINLDNIHIGLVLSDSHSLEDMDEEDMSEEISFPNIILLTSTARWHEINLGRSGEDFMKWLNEEIYSHDVFLRMKGTLLTK